MAYVSKIQTADVYNNKYIFDPETEAKDLFIVSGCFVASDSRDLMSCSGIFVLTR